MHVQEVLINESLSKLPVYVSLICYKIVILPRWAIITFHSDTMKYSSAINYITTTKRNNVSAEVPNIILIRFPFRSVSISGLDSHK